MQFWEFGGGFKYYFNIEHRGRCKGESGGESGRESSSINYNYLVENDKFLTSVLEYVPAVIEKFK